MNNYKKISRDLLQYSVFSGFFLGLCVSLLVFLKLYKTHKVLYLSINACLLFLSPILLIWRYRLNKLNLDYREVFTMCFLILFFALFFRYISFLAIETKTFYLTEFLVSLLPCIPYSFLVATFLKKIK